MPIIKPYFRIVREATSWPDYIFDRRYSKDRMDLVRAYKVLEGDLKEIFEFIEPCDDNLEVYSHRLYELFLRCCTEFETNCKQILLANSYKKDGNMNIEDYFRINRAMMLSKYEVKINIWHPKPKKITPFKAWEDSHSLVWYQEYNEVKHHRSEKFNLANLKNVLFSAASVFCILNAQFRNQAFASYSQQNDCDVDDERFIHANNSLFSIKPFYDWPPEETYSIDWNKIKNLPNPFVEFSF